MKVFDFDNTIYNGESSVDFSFYMIRNKKKIIWYIPTILFSLAGYKLCLIKKERLESIINDFIAGVLDDPESLPAYVRQFWKTHACKLNRNILRLIGPDDVILSASPNFLFDGIRKKLNTERIIGMEVDLKKKKITWFNYGDNKVKRYRELYGDRKIEAFYTDSYNDKDSFFLINNNARAHYFSPQTYDLYFHSHEYICIVINPKTCIAIHYLMDFP